jgi:dTDP-4-amino-4,6-dideoxygalactose transaminase
MAQLALLGGDPIRTQPFPRWPVFDDAERDALLRALHGRYWGLYGDGEIERFERRFAEYQETQFATAVVNGTVALRIALLAAGISAGDEVIVPPYTFVATASAVLECNATPVFADVDPATLNLDPAAVAAAITPRTRALIPVHIGGLPCEMDELCALARAHDLVVIEDAAHAHGAEYKGRRVGGIGQLGCFSFQSSKNLTCGEGGAVLTSDPRLHERVRAIHNCGRAPQGAWYEHHLISGNYRITEFQAALLNTQLDRLEAQVQQRERNALSLQAQLAAAPGITPQRRPAYPIRHGNHLFHIRYDAAQFGVPREIFLRALRAEGVPASSGYPVPLYRQPLFASAQFTPYGAVQPRVPYDQVQCPNCERLCATEAVWFYQSVLLGTAADVADIARAIAKLYECRAALRTVPPTEASA